MDLSGLRIFTAVVRAGGGIYWDSPPGYYHNRDYASTGPVGDGRATLSSQAFLNTFPGIVNLFTGAPIPVGSPIPVGVFSNMTLRQFDQIYQSQIGAITAKVAPPPPTSAPSSEPTGPVRSGPGPRSQPGPPSRGTAPRCRPHRTGPGRGPPGTCR